MLDETGEGAESISGGGIARQADDDEHSARSREVREPAQPGSEVREVMPLDGGERDVGTPS